MTVQFSQFSKVKAIVHICSLLLANNNEVKIFIKEHSYFHAHVFLRIIFCNINVKMIRTRKGPNKHAANRYFNFVCENAGDILPHCAND